MQVDSILYLPSCAPSHMVGPLSNADKSAVSVFSPSPWNPAVSSHSNQSHYNLESKIRAQNFIDFLKKIFT